MKTKTEQKLDITEALLENSKLVKSLPIRLQKLLKKRYGLYTLKEMGEEMNVTEERVRQLERVALDKIGQKMIKINKKEHE